MLSRPQPGRGGAGLCMSIRTVTAPTALFAAIQPGEIYGGTVARAVFPESESGELFIALPAVITGHISNPSEWFFNVPQSPNSNFDPDAGALPDVIR